MSKRARITLVPEVVEETEQTPPPAEEPDSESVFKSSSAANHNQAAEDFDQQPSPSFTASPAKNETAARLLNTGNVIRAALVTAAVVALVVFWKSRKP